MEIAARKPPPPGEEEGPLHHALERGGGVHQVQPSLGQRPDTNEALPAIRLAGGHDSAVRQERAVDPHVLPSSEVGDRVKRELQLRGPAKASHLVAAGVPW